MVALPDELVVEVTAEDIAKGKPCNSLECAIAVAVKRMGISPAVMVDGAYLTVQGRGEDGVSYVRVYDLPPEAQDFIHDFDEHFEVKPLTFSAEAV